MSYLPPRVVCAALILLRRSFSNYCMGDALSCRFAVSMPPYNEHYSKVAGRSGSKRGHGRRAPCPASHAAEKRERTKTVKQAGRARTVTGNRLEHKRLSVSIAPRLVLYISSLIPFSRSLFRSRATLLTSSHPTNPSISSPNQPHSKKKPLQPSIPHHHVSQGGRLPILGRLRPDRVRALQRRGEEGRRQEGRRDLRLPAEEQRGRGEVVVHRPEGDGRGGQGRGARGQEGRHHHDPQRGQLLQAHRRQGQRPEAVHGRQAQGQGRRHEGHQDRARVEEGAGQQQALDSPRRAGGTLRIPFSLASTKSSRRDLRRTLGFAFPAWGGTRSCSCLGVHGHLVGSDVQILMAMEDGYLDDPNYVMAAPVGPNLDIAMDDFHVTKVLYRPQHRQVSSPQHN
nr:hypothetical protein CFP56_07815 [Quercus suber]